MKRFITYLIVCAMSMTVVSCEKFLDKSPDMGLTDSDIYKNYESARGYLDQAYTYLENLYGFNKCKNGRTHIGAISDEFASLYNNAEAIYVNNGNWLAADISNFEVGYSSSNGGTSIWKSYKGLRIVNRIIRDYQKIPGLTQQQQDELLGQAYFLRGWFYFQLIRRYGGMPILDQLFSGDGSEDLPRKTYHESHDWMITDLEQAITMLPDDWDDNNTGRPTKVAAMALKSMAQLYDASPLMQNGLTETVVHDYDKERAKLAAQSAYKVIDYVSKSANYALMSGADYKHIFYWTTPPYTQPEYLWYNREQDTPGTYNYMRYIRCYWLPSELSQGTGNDAVVYNAPTQNMVDLYEKKGADGIYYPIDDPRAGYDLQDPYTDRDPRFYNNILCPGDEWGHNSEGVPQYITTWVGGQMYNTTLKNNQSNKRFQTGYLCKKYLWPEANQWIQGYNLYRTITVFIRVSQIYLDFAEASFEATGSATAKVEGCDLSAVDALNIIRNRVGVTDVPSDIVSDPVKFREAYRRERAVELMFENNRWWDIRRWMIAHELFKDDHPIKGISATPKSGGGYTYEVTDVIPEQRVFTMRNYWYPFSMNDVAGLNNLVQNPGW